MKNLFKTFALAAVAVVGVVACAEDGIEGAITTDSATGLTLFATISTPVETKVSFTEDAVTQTIALDWSEGDSFILYNGDTELDNFTTATGDGKFTSSDPDLTLDEGTTYTAKFNVTADPTTQNGDAIANLAAACQLEASFTYGEDESITFEHINAIMTFQFESDNRPAYLLFEDGEMTYKVTYSEIVPNEDGLYTSHIMITPSGDDVTLRTLTFTLYDSDNLSYDIRTVDTAKEYKAGYRYTAPVSSLANTIWDGEGSGTEEDPYKIANIDDLRQLSTKVNSGISYSGKYFEMTDNIDLEGTEENQWTAIGYFTSSSDKAYFKGNFNGAGYEISGLYINTTSRYQGLFGYISGATITNVKITSGSIAAGGNVGSVVGNAIKYSSIIACSNACTVTGTSACVGGIVGDAEDTSITACSNSGNISCDAYYVGGIVGSNQSATIYSCNNSGNVNGVKGHVGGVTGCSLSASVISLCNNSGDITCSSVENYAYVGGIAGSNVSNSSAAEDEISAVTSCFNSGNVSGGRYVGGVVGRNYDIRARIISCGNSGNVSSSGYDSGVCYVGGVTGYNYLTAKVISCYNTGDVSGNILGTYSLYIGGVVGQNYHSSATINISYNSGALSSSGDGTGSVSIGGVTGRHCYAVVYSSYYDNEVYTGDAIGVNATATYDCETTAMETAEMKAASFVKTLNELTYAYNSEDIYFQANGWVESNGGYPEIDFYSRPTAEGGTEQISTALE